MAIIRTNFAWYDAMAKGLTATNNFLDSTNGDNYIEIYSGSMPDDADDFFPGYGGSPGAGSPLVQLLATFNDFKISQHIYPTDGSELDVQEAIFSTSAITYTPTPSTVNATATGTAAWYAMWDTSRVAQYGALLGDISLSGGNGTLQLDSLDIVSGEPVQLLHWGVRFQS